MFSEIEQARDAAGIKQSDLCKRAGVHETTYTARKQGRRTLSERTINKLRNALREIIQERRTAIDAAVETKRSAFQCEEVKE